MATHDMVKGVKIPKDGVFSFCKECVEGKMARKPFMSVGEVHSVRKLQCVHSDVRRPMPTESIGRRRYFVLLLMIIVDVVGCT